MEFLNVKQVADRLNVSNKQVYSLIRQGFVEATRAFGPLLVSSEHLENLIREVKTRASEVCRFKRRAA